MGPHFERAAEASRMPAPQRASALRPAPASVAEQRAEHAGSTSAPHLSPHEGKSASPAHSHLRFWKTSGCALQTHSSPSNLQIQFLNRTLCGTERVRDDFSITTFKSNTVNDYSSFSQWNTSRTVSLKALRQRRLSTLPTCMCLHQLSLSSRSTAAGLSSCEPSPHTCCPAFGHHLAELSGATAPAQQHKNLSRRMLFLCP